MTLSDTINNLESLNTDQEACHVEAGRDWEDEGEGDYVAPHVFRCDASTMFCGLFGQNHTKTC